MIDLRRQGSRQKLGFDLDMHSDGSIDIVIVLSLITNRLEVAIVGLEPFFHHSLWQERAQSIRSYV